MSKSLLSGINGCVSLYSIVLKPFHSTEIYLRSTDFIYNDIQTLEDLKALPVLSRETVQHNFSNLLSNAINESQRRIAQTSGSTGAGLRVANYINATYELWAVCFRYRKWHGLLPGTWCGHFGGRPVVTTDQNSPPFWRYNIPGKQVLFSAYHINEKHLPYYIGELRKRKLPWLHGYPSLLTLIAAYILDHSIDLGYQAKWITIGSENLLPQQREIIAKAFGIMPRQHYAMTELAANISECERGKLHVDEDFAAVEFIPIQDGKAYKIIGTNMANLAMPLIRYDIQDNAIIVKDDYM
jgi:phenylacetate-CoA ligase